jgi:hypothetical protein
MSVDEAIEVYTRRHPNDWQTATYKLADIEELHWNNVSGGVGRRTSHDTLFGYVWCNGAVAGEVAHSCRHGQGPHRIKVCLPKGLNKDNWKAILGCAPAS